MGTRTEPSSTTMPEDPDLPGVPGLFGEEGPAQVAGFLDARGWMMRDARAVQALYRPGRSCVVRYQVLADSPRLEPRVLTVCVETRVHVEEPPPAPSGFAERYGLEEPVEARPPYQVYVFPYDPVLGGLPDAAWAPAVRDAMNRLENGTIAVSTQPLRYRPRRRAVFRYLAAQRGGEARVRPFFGKVLRGSRARASLGVAASAPRNLRGPRRSRFRRPPVRLAFPVGEIVRGTLLFPPLPGRSLRELLIAGGTLPAPERVGRVLDDLARLGSDLVPAQALERWRPSEGAEETARLLRVLVPRLDAQVGAVVDAVREGEANDPIPPRLVHGDLYEDQVFVAENFSLGLLDLDDLGPGDPALDAANFCAHLVALALSAPAAADRLLAYRSLIRETFAARLGVPPSSLAWRESLAMLLLASGPFRVLDPGWPQQTAVRVEIAASLLADRWSGKTSSTIRKRP
jgi:hypothetical protein